MGGGCLCLIACLAQLYACMAQLDENAPWPMSGHDLRHTARTAAIVPRVNVSVRWSFSTGAAINFAGAAVGSNGVVYFASSDYVVYAVREETGELLWQFSTGNVVESTPALAADGGLYVTSTNGKLYKLNASDGSAIWSLGTGYQVTASPLISPWGAVYFGCSDSAFWAVASNGTLLWRTPVGDGNFFWASMAVLDATTQTVFTAGGSTEPTWGRVHAFNAISGREEWATPVLLNRAFSPHAPEVTLQKNTLTPKLYLDPNQTECTGTPALSADGSRLFAACGYALSAFDTATGALLWNFSLRGVADRSSPALGTNGAIYLGDSSGTFYGVTPAGKQIWNASVGAAIHSAPALDGAGGVFFGAADGFLYAYDT